MKALPLFHRVSGQPVIVLGEGEPAEAKRRLIERAGGIAVEDEREAIEGGARLAFVALDGPAAEAAAARLRRAGLLVNVVDRPELCDFVTPSILERDPVVIAIGTDGASASLAKHLRLRLEAILPASLGLLAESLNAARGAIRARWADSTERRMALDLALREGGVLDPFSGAGPVEVAQWLTERRATLRSNRIDMVVGDDPDALTLRQLQLLGAAETILYAPGVPNQVLHRARADAERLPLEQDDGRARPGLTIVLRLG